MARECMLTTFDNPYDPFTQFREWNAFDVEHGYNTCNYIGRLVQLSDDMTELEEIEEAERAIEQIIDCDFLNIYKKVYKDG